MKNYNFFKGLSFLNIPGLKKSESNKHKQKLIGQEFKASAGLKKIGFNKMAYKKL